MNTFPFHCIIIPFDCPFFRLSLKPCFEHLVKLSWACRMSRNLMSPSGTTALGSSSSCDNAFIPGPSCEANLNFLTGANLINYGICLSDNTGICNFGAGTLRLRCDLYPVRYTWLFAPSICKVVLHICLISFLASNILFPFSYHTGNRDGPRCV